jgi:hypothetical protein
MFSALIDDTTLQIPTFNQRYDLGHGDFVDALASFPGTLLNIPISMANAIPAGLNAGLKTASVISGVSQDEISNSATALIASSGPAAPLIFAGELPLMPAIIMNRVNRLFKGSKAVRQLDKTSDQLTIPHQSYDDVPDLPSEFSATITREGDGRLNINYGTSDTKAATNRQSVERSRFRNSDEVEEGRLYEAEQLQTTRNEGKNVTGRNRLVPQNGSGNVPGNRTDTDQLIKNDNGSFSIVETKRSSTSKLSKGQNAAKENVESGDGMFEIRTNQPQQGLKKGDIIHVEEYMRKNKHE